MTPLLRRLARSSPRELIDRGTERLTIAAERVRVAGGLEHWNRRDLARCLHAAGPNLTEARRALEAADWTEAEAHLQRHFGQRPRRFPIDVSRREPIVSAIVRRFPSAPREAADRADHVLAGRVDLLAYRHLRVQHGAGEGDVDWHADPVHDRRAPGDFWHRVRFLDPSIGDHKVIWELNRHQHWLALGRAAWLNGRAEYGRRFADELESWLRTNPPLWGINWASMLELGFRSLSWLWALHFFNDCVPIDGGGSDRPWRVGLLLGIDRQLRHVERHLSTYFSPNTHLLGEGLALYVAGRTLPELVSAARWEDKGRHILLREAHRQVNADGGHAERSAHYHRYALDFYLLALSIARITEDPVASAFEEVTGRLAGFCRAIAGDDGRLPMLGDDDGGLLFPICRRDPADAGDSLALAAALLGRPELAIGEAPEEVYWMLGGEPPPAPAGGAIGSAIFPDTGYAALRSSHSHAVLDVGVHGFLNGGHAHADALALVLSLGGRPLLVDPGTATYTMDPELRDRFRSSAMHNTVQLDGRPQSVPAGPFHWRSRADARLDLRRAAADFEIVEGSHDGYQPAVHRRAVTRAGDLWLVVDHVLDTARHDVQVHWHLEPRWTLEREEGSAVSFRHADGFRAGLASTARGRDVFRGVPQGLGWYAPIYGLAVPSLTLRHSDGGPSPLTLMTAIAPDPAATLTIEALAVSAERHDGWHRAAGLVHHGATRVVALFAAPITAAAGPRSLQHVSAEDGAELVTDARAALLALAPSGAPLSLHVIDATIVMWSGSPAFDLPSAGDLHLDRAALGELSHSRTR
jgi:hypothetical protein